MDIPGRGRWNVLRRPRSWPSLSGGSLARKSPTRRTPSERTPVAIAQDGFEALRVDLVRAPNQLAGVLLQLRSTTVLSIGVVDGRTSGARILMQHAYGRGAAGCRPRVARTVVLAPAFARRSRSRAEGRQRGDSGSCLQSRSSPSSACSPTRSGCRHRLARRSTRHAQRDRCATVRVSDIVRRIRIAGWSLREGLESQPGAPGRTFSVSPSL